MITIIGVRFRNVGKVYYFSPRELDICVGDHVIVETARGVEYGFVVLGPKEVDDLQGDPAVERSHPHCNAEG